MTSKLIVNELAADTGITTITVGDNMSGVTFKTGTSNLHNVGIEIAGINVLGADTPIGAGATIYNSGDVIVGGAITATKFVGTFENSGDFTIDDYVVHAGDTNTKFGFSAADTFKIDTAGDERLRITSGGILLKGNTASQEVYGTNSFQIQGTSALTSGMSLLRHGGSPYLVLGSTGGSSVGAVNAVSGGNRLGQLTFVGADGTDVNTHAASIAAYADGSVSSNTVPGRLVFATSSGPGEVERLRIDSDGKVGINTSDPRFDNSNTASANKFYHNDPKFGVKGSITIGNLSATATDER